MSRTNRIIVNVLALQAGWFACVLGASWGWPMSGPLVVALLLLIHLTLAPSRQSEARFVVVAGIVGTLVDSSQVAAGTMLFQEQQLFGTLLPPWMIALWLNFATAVNVSLRFLRGRYLLAGALGAIGGASAYYGAATLGALSFPREAWLGVTLIGLEWGLMMPLLVWMATHMCETE